MTIYFFKKKTFRFTVDLHFNNDSRYKISKSNEIFTNALIRFQSAPIYRVHTFAGAKMDTGTLMFHEQKTNAEHITVLGLAKKFPNFSFSLVALCR